MDDAAESDVPHRIIVRVVVDRLSATDAHAALDSLESWMAQESIGADAGERRPFDGGSKSFELWELVYLVTGVTLGEAVSAVKAGIRSWQVHRDETNGRAETVRLIDGDNPAEPPDELDPRDIGLEPDDHDPRQGV